jgi:2-oxoadipate dioxygenase/decarboxylase-like protein
MSIEQFFRELWNSYTRITPSAGAIMELFTHWGEMPGNDHIAIRTFSDPRVNISAVAQPFTDRGYLPRGHYNFPEKKLKALHFEHPDKPGLPKVFISELQLEAFSSTLQQIVFNTLRDTDKRIFEEPDLILRGRIWGLPCYDIYETLRQESEYAAWIYVFGFCVNHFTVSVNGLRKFDSLEQVNEFLRSNGFALNTAGGLIKGGPDQFFEQSGILADRVKVHFREGHFMIPACYYGFSRRYPGADGKLYQGFLDGSGAKMFEYADRKMAGQTNFQTN